MKTLYMHLGTSKTATSSIQVACARNTELLNQHGYGFPLFPCAYPRVRKERNGHFLIEASMMRNIVPDQETTWQDRLSLGLKMIHDEFEKYDNVILTDENFWRFLNYGKQNPLSILRKDADEFGYRIKTIVYLRRQDSFLISRWNQLVKEGTMTDSLSDNLNMILKKEPLIMDYAASLDKIVSQIGKENVIVRRFDSSSWINGSIYADFSDAIGLPPEIILPSRKSKLNPGLKGNTVDIQLSINRLSGLTLEDKIYFSSINKKLSQELPEDDQFNPLSQQEIVSFLAHFEAGNERIAREYICDGKPMFSSEVHELPKWSAGNRYYWEDVTAFVSMLPPEKRILLQAASLFTLDAKIGTLRQKCNQLSKENRRLNQECKQLSQERDKSNQEYTSLSHKLTVFKTTLKHSAKTVIRKLMKK